MGIRAIAPCIWCLEHQRTVKIRSIGPLRGSPRRREGKDTGTEPKETGKKGASSQTLSMRILRIGSSHRLPIPFRPMLGKGPERSMRANLMKLAKLGVMRPSIILIGTVLFLQWSCSVLSPVKKTYTYDVPYEYEKIHLKGDSFTYRAHHCAWSMSGNGVYQWKGDSLVLDFRGGPEPVPKEVEESEMRIEPFERKGEESSRVLALEIRDKGSNDPVPLADVFLRSDDADFKKEWESDLYGKVECEMPKKVDTVDLVVGHAGYQNLETKVRVSQSSTVKVHLAESKEEPRGHDHEVRHGHQKIYRVLESSKDTVKMKHVKNGDFNIDVRKFEYEQGGGLRVRKSN